MNENNNNYITHIFKDKQRAEEQLKKYIKL